MTLLPPDALSLLSMEVPVLVYQDILGAYKEKGIKPLKDCKRSWNQVSYFFRDIPTPYGNEMWLGFWYIYTSDLLHDLGQVTHAFCAFVSVSAS